MDIEKIIAAARAAEEEKGASGQEVPQQSATGQEVVGSPNKLNKSNRKGSAVADGQEQGASVEVSADNSDKVSKGRKKSERVQNNELEGSAVQSQDISFNNSAPLGYKADGTPRQRRQGAGRPNRGLTALHNEQRKEFTRTLRRSDNSSNNFPVEIIENITGEVVDNDDIEQFAELYKLTCYSCYDKYMNEHPEAVKQQPYTFYKRIILDIKHNTPQVLYTEIDKLIVVWDILKEFMSYIGLYITYELFKSILKIYDYQLKQCAEVNPRYSELLRKINDERDGELLNEIAYNPYTQVNKMFIAKTHGIVEQQQPRQVEVVHNIQHFDSISRYRLAESD